MVFGSPWMLIGLGLCAVPVLIHLLSRRSQRQERWAAMTFLRAALDRRTRQLRLESLLLLLIRTLVILLLVFAVAEPLFYSAPIGRSLRAPLRRILVVDLSASMGRQVSGARSIDRARAEIETLLQESLPGDSFQLVRIAATAPRTLIRREIYDPAEVLSELSRWELTDERGDVAESLRAVVELAGQSDDDRAEVLIFSDLQRSNWWPDDPELRAHNQRLLADLTRQCRTTFIDLGAAPEQNLAISDLRSERPVAVPGQTLVLTAMVRNFSHSSTTARLEWVVDGKPADNVSVEVPGLSEAAVRHPVTAATQGFLEVEARLTGGDSLPADDRRFLTVPVRERLRVLLVDGSPGVQPIDGAAGFVALSLSPVPSAGGSGSTVVPIQPEVVAETDLAAIDLERFDCVWLCNVPDLDSMTEQRLRGYVERGGGLIVSVGDQTRPERWNNWNDTQGRGFLPVTLERVIDVIEQGGQPLTFRLAAIPHSALAAFAGNPRSGLTTTRIHRYMAAELRDTADVRRVVDLSDGDPAIASQTVGAGQVVVLLVPADDRWSNWGVWPSFLPMVHGLTVFAATGSSHQMQIVSGGVIERHWPPSHTAGETTMIDPKGRRVSLPKRCSADDCRIAFDGTSSTGFYRLEFDSPVARQESIAVNLDPVESVGSTLDESLLSREVLPKDRFRYGTRWMSVGTTSQERRNHGELSGVLLVTVLVLLVIEKLMSWRSRWGLAALTVAGLGVVLMQTIWMDVRLAIALLLLVLSAGIVFRHRLMVGPRRP
ncbi:MAG: BatA domain-containing protein [Planctomycetaceae bacterium]|nr:BatA domain-containing protein [Planctomycetaceae bacterium]